uniref:hypothetical protein n=1 Tax=Candidatus Electronema sp. TaxID=2698783 RepID=UPI004057C033
MQENEHGPLLRLHQHLPGRRNFAGGMPPLPQGLRRCTHDLRRFRILAEIEDSERIHDNARRICLTAP